MQIVPTVALMISKVLFNMGGHCVLIKTNRLKLKQFKSTIIYVNLIFYDNDTLKSLKISRLGIYLL